MRRVLAICAVLAIAGTLVVLATGASNGGGGDYKVRAIFANAFSLVPGDDLNEVIRNADPALKATDKVLKLLASQDKVLADLAKQSDIALAPLARERAHVAGFVQHAEEVATATADQRGAFQAQFEKLPE